jgi:adenylosuccinate synthase
MGAQDLYVSDTAGWQESHTGIQISRLLDGEDVAKKETVICQGMAYGDEGKGATVDFLCRDLNATLIVRYNGGPQCAHNVVMEDGRHHTFAQFGSGTLRGVRTHLSRFMLVDPITMLVEDEHLQHIGVKDAFDRTTVHEDCVVVTIYHRAFNRLEEMSRGHRAHGSTGMGVGCARKLELEGISLRVKDLCRGFHTSDKMDAIRTRLMHDAEAFAYNLEETPEKAIEFSLLTQPPSKGWFWAYRHWKERIKVVPEFMPEDLMVFEGAQGVLLDEKHGEAPYNTWTNTTFENALTLLADAGYDGEVTKMGCWRTYFTRHGNGPFPTEQDGLIDHRPELHNTHGRWQGPWRVGSFDYQQAARATNICGGIDGIALSHWDIAHLDTELLEYTVKAPVTIMGYGPTANDRRRIK